MLEILCQARARRVTRNRWHFGVILLILAIVPRSALCGDFNASGIKPICPTFLGASDFRPESLQGVVEFSDAKPAKPVRGAEITVMCRDGKVLAQVETGANGHYEISRMQLSVDYNCLVDPKIPGYLKGEMHCITTAFLDWQLSKGLDPVVTPCSPASWSRDTCLDRQVLKYRAFDPESVEISGTVVYYTKNPPFKFAPDVIIEVCSASGKLLRRARTDAQGYYELHLPKDLSKNDSPYSCVLHAPAGYLGGEASCVALGWTLRRGQIPTATSSGRCDYVYGCPGSSITPIDVQPVHPLRKRCLP
jgi:hypothetical protein